MVQYLRVDACQCRQTILTEQVIWHRCMIELSFAGVRSPRLLHLQRLCLLSWTVPERLWRVIAWQLRRVPIGELQCIRCAHASMCSWWNSY